jgi:hypothetical protein
MRRGNARCSIRAATFTSSPSRSDPPDMSAFRAECRLLNQFPLWLKSPHRKRPWPHVAVDGLVGVLPFRHKSAAGLVVTAIRAI